MTRCRRTRHHRVQADIYSECKRALYEFTKMNNDGANGGGYDKMYYYDMGVQYVTSDRHKANK